MNRTTHHLMACLALILFLLTSGCSWNTKYARLKPSSQNTQKVTIDALVANWENYVVHYAGPSIGSASGVIFDPKNDNKTLQLQKWYPVKDQQELADIVRWLKANIRFEPTLYEIVVADNQVFGYIFTPWSHVLIKRIDENTLWVEELPLPPIDYGGGGVLGGF